MSRLGTYIIKLIFNVHENIIRNRMMETVMTDFANGQVDQL